VKEGKEGRVGWLDILLMFSGSAFLDVISESPLFPPDGEAYVLVEVYVAICSDVDIVAVLSAFIAPVVEAGCRSLTTPSRPWP
jgi:hypothetical protein